MRYIIITPLKYTINDQNLNTVDQLWDLETNSKFIKNINVFAPFLSDQHLITQNGSMYTFSRDDSSISFSPLPDFKNPFDFLYKLPVIGYRICTKINKDDIVHCTGTAYPPIGIIANTILWFKKHKKYIFVLDADFIRDLKLRIESEKAACTKWLFKIFRYLYLSIFIFCIKTFSLTFLVVDELYGKYQQYGNVYKIYASWVKETNIISDDEILHRSNALLIKKEFKLTFVANLVTKKNPKTAIETLMVLKNRGIPVTLDILGESHLKPELEAFVKKSNLSNIVKFKGFVSHNFLYSELFLMQWQMELLSSALNWNLSRR
jgi:glycosyltransferase involved in cell wall biosynthesis